MTSSFFRFSLLMACSTVFLTSCGGNDQDSKTKKDSSQGSDVADSNSDKDGKSQLMTVAVVPVKSEMLSHKLELPGELLAYQNVPVHAKVEGYIKDIFVDRGSFVKKGEAMILISCPELNEKVKEAEAKLSSAESSYRQAQATVDAVKSKLIEAKARCDADRLTLSRLQQAAKTPGAVAQNEVDIQEKAFESDQARVESVKQEVLGAKNLVLAESHNVQAARQVLNSVKDMTGYLTIRAPFDGVVTERNVHNGSIVAVSTGREAPPLVRVQEKNHLRLVVAVPEDSVSGTKIGQKIEFSVPAFIGKQFFGKIARPGYALDSATRTMPVELDVPNANGELEPGMFATVHWLVSRPYKTLFVPASAVDSDLKGTFVIRVKDNVSERIDVQKGLSMGERVELSGKIDEGDLIALKATNEIKSGTHLLAKIADENEIKRAAKHASAGGE
ncbi:MAG: efflux RND transporter periplasmic adaptor subunit [Cyanobacteria bacterium SZAS-4]|nr:efflux RND transporter periplasmic adaptor subunit [Cyanobacteria bacterium SZAS-4]